METPEASLTQRLGVGLLDRGDQPGGPVGDDQQRGGQAAAGQVGQGSPAWSPSASARVASTSRTDSPRMNEAITRDSSALVLVTCAPNSREANASLVPRSFGRASPTGPAVVLTVTSR